MSAEILVVVPMKDPRAAKTRLKDAMGPGARARFARLLFRRTLNLLTALQSDRTCPHFDLAVVTRAKPVAEIARQAGARVISEDEGDDLNGAVSRAALAAQAEGYAAMLILPADLAVPDPQDIRAFIRQAQVGTGVTLCPSQDYGTNMLLVSPPDAIPFAFGPGSFHAHSRNARAAGVDPVVLPLDSLRWDIDRSGDLERLQTIAPDLLHGEGPG